MSDDLLSRVPSKEHVHDLALVYLSQTVDMNSISYEELALKYLETRKKLNRAFIDNVRKYPTSKL